MLTKKEVKDIQNLSLAAFRREQGLFVVEGPKMVGELLQAVPERVQAIFATSDWQGPKGFAVEITAAELAKLSQLSTPNQVLAIVRQSPSDPPPADAFVLYLDTIQDPGNMGTIIRTADWFGVQHTVCSRGCADVYSSKVVQATMSSIIRVNVFADTDDTWLTNQQRPIYAAALDGQPVTTTGKSSNAVLIIGNESKGIRKEFFDLATHRVTIPGRGGAESLNAAVAAGILLAGLTPGPSPAEL